MALNVYVLGWIILALLIIIKDFVRPGKIINYVAYGCIGGAISAYFGLPFLIQLIIAIVVTLLIIRLVET